jgi:hypothetical protein
MRGVRVHISRSQACSTRAAHTSRADRSTEQEIRQGPISSVVDEDEDRFSVNMSTLAPGIMAAGSLSAGDTITADLDTQTFDNLDITDNSNTAGDTLLPSRDMPSSSVRVVRAGIEATELDLGSLLRPSDEIDEVDFEPLAEDTPDDARSIDDAGLDYVGDEPDLGEPDGIADDDQSTDQTMADIGNGGDTGEGGSNPTDNSAEDPCFDKATEYAMYGHPGAAQVFTLPDGEFPDVPRESQFEKRRKKDDPRRKFHPFSSSAEWGLVKWLTRSGLSKASIDEFCKLDWVSTDREWCSGIRADPYLT